MPSSTDIPVITTERIAELSERTGTTFFRSRRALQAAGGDMARAVQLLSEVKEQRSTRTPQYGTELTRALGAVPGFAHGYPEASRQLEFGRQLRVLREERGLSQMELAEQAHVDQGDISRFESGKWGKRGISFEMLERILPVLGYQLEHRILPTSSESATDRAQEAAVVLTGLLAP